jgi:hypothetical protein
MQGIDHLVIAGRDLDELRRSYGSLGFTLTPRARHPFGTGNSLVQLQGSFLELLGIVEPAGIVEPSAGQFSFGAFNRDFLKGREGMSMLVLESQDARADQERYRQAGLDTYEPFDFSRIATLPDGAEARVGFSLAFATNPQMPLSAFFTCQQHAPEHFWQKIYQSHPNTARSVEEVCLVATDPRKLLPFLSLFTGVKPVKNCYDTGRGVLRVLRPQQFEMRYGLKAPPVERGARFAGFTIGVHDMAYVSRLNLKRSGIRLVADVHGTAIAFIKAKRH